MSERWRNFNANHTVRVQLTDHGRELRQQAWTALMDGIAGWSYRPKEEDADGWSEWQLHELMSEFGSEMTMGNPRLPFAMTIQFDMEAS